MIEEANRQSELPLRYALAIIFAGVLATTLAQPDVLARISLQNLLKNELHESQTMNSAFFFWSGLAWYLKPIAGIVIDVFPLFGSRYKNYIIMGAGASALLWFVLIFVPHNYRDFLFTSIAINFFMVVTSTVIGGFLVERAHASASAGRLTAVRQVTTQGCSIVTGRLGGYLASISFGWTAAACGSIMLILVPVTILLLHERKRSSDYRQVLEDANRKFSSIATARTMWLAAGLLALYYIAPGFGTALFYKQQNELHFTTQQQGFLQSLSGIFGVIAAILYGIVCRRFSMRKLLAGSLILSGATTLGFEYYYSWPSAEVIESVNGFVGAFAELALLDLAVRATPIGNESFGYSVMLSVRNLALFGTDLIGSKLIDDYHVSINALVVANSVTTFVVVPLIFLLPKQVMHSRDA
jgi:MFS family permease